MALLESKMLGPARFTLLLSSSGQYEHPNQFDLQMCKQLHVGCYEGFF